LRLACGYILWHIRHVDDGTFRKHVCEALLVCYILQSLAVFRAQLSISPSRDEESFIVWCMNWVAVAVLSTLASSYIFFRFRQGGHLIKVYELPTSRSLV
jgi:hypothetical protein